MNYCIPLKFIFSIEIFLRIWCVVTCYLVLNGGGATWNIVPGAQLLWLAVGKAGAYEQPVAPGLGEALHRWYHLVPETYSLSRYSQFIAFGSLLHEVLLIVRWVQIQITVQPCRKFIWDVSQAERLDLQARQEPLGSALSGDRLSDIWPIEHLQHVKVKQHIN